MPAFLREDCMQDLEANVPLPVVAAVRVGMEAGRERRVHYPG